MKTNLQAMRKKAGYRSARAFAEHIGMNVATYTDYEQGRHSFTLEKAWEFADLLGCSLDELAGRQWPPEGAAAPADPRREALLASYDQLNDDGRTIASEAVASMARDPLRRADAGEGGGPVPGGLEAQEAV